MIQVYKYLPTSTIFVFLLWIIITKFQFINHFYLPSPLEVLLSIKPSIIIHVVYTLIRLLSAFILSLLIGIPIGLFMGWSRNVYKSLEFLVDFSRSIPASALFPLFILFFGIGDLAKIAAAAWASGFVIIINTMYGVFHARQMRLKMAKIMNVPLHILIIKILFPESLPSIMVGIRQAVSLSLVIIVITEMFIGTDYGLGQVIIDSQLVYRIPEMYSAIIITGLLGYILNKLFLIIERRVVHWVGK